MNPHKRKNYRTQSRVYAWLGGTLLTSSIASGEILLTFSETPGLVTLSVSGSWDVWNPSGSNTVKSAFVGLIDGVSASSGQDEVGLVLSASPEASGDSSDQFFLSGLAEVPWSGSFEALNFSGDEFSFYATDLSFAPQSVLQRVAPVGYVAGQSLNATTQFAGTLADLGLSPESSGVIDLVTLGGPENISWQTVAAIPEPSGSVLLALAGFGGICFRRR